MNLTDEATGMKRDIMLPKMEEYAMLHKTRILTESPLHTGVDESIGESATYDDLISDYCTVIRATSLPPSRWGRQMMTHLAAVVTQQTILEVTKVNGKCSIHEFYPEAVGGGRNGKYKVFSKSSKFSSKVR